MHTGASCYTTATYALRRSLHTRSRAKRQPRKGQGLVGMHPPPPAKKAAAGSEDATSAEPASMLPPPGAPAPLADNTPNAQGGDGKQPELAGENVRGTFLPPPPPKKSSAVAGGVKKAAPTGESYRPPSWGVKEAPEASGLSLTVLKGGIEVNSISLDNRTHILLGEL